MKLSAVTKSIAANWCHCPPGDPAVIICWDAAKQHVLSYTGLDAESADEHEALTVAALSLASAMYYNREMLSDSDKINKVAESFMSAYDHNLLPSGDGA